ALIVRGGDELLVARSRRDRRARRRYAGSRDLSGVFSTGEQCMGAYQNDKGYEELFHSAVSLSGWVCIAMIGRRAQAAGSAGRQWPAAKHTASITIVFTGALVPQRL